MIAVVDFRNGRARFGNLTADGLTWVSGHDGVAVLEKARRVFGWSRKTPSGVVVTTFGPEATADVSWSVIRGAIATANALGFAWGVPTAVMPAVGDEDDAWFEKAAKRALKGAAADNRASASYSGEPHITKAKA